MGPDVTALLAAPEGIFNVLKLRLCTKKHNIIDYISTSLKPRQSSTIFNIETEVNCTRTCSIQRYSADVAVGPLAKNTRPLKTFSNLLQPRNNKQIVINTEIFVLFPEGIALDFT